LKHQKSGTTACGIGMVGIPTKKGVRILSADRLRERPFGRGRQLREALDGNLGRCRFEELRQPRAW
jgi:hypothetical protein